MLVEAGQGLPLAAVGTPHGSQGASSVVGVILQKSTSVTVRDKGPVDTIQPSTMSTSSMSTSVSEHEPVASQEFEQGDAEEEIMVYRQIFLATEATVYRQTTHL